MLWHLLRVLLPSWRLVLLGMCLAGTAAGTWRLLQPRMWKAEASIMPLATGSSPSALAGMAAQFGFNMQSGDPMQSPALYVELLQSREFLDRLVDAVGGEAVVAAAFDVQEPDAGRRYELMLRHMGDALEVNADPKTNVVRITAFTRDTVFSRALVTRAMDVVQQLGVARRHARHGAERAFTTTRRTAAEDELRRAEENLRAFRLSNRSWTTSPRLMTDAERLQRRVGEAQALLQVLRQAEEQSRLEELRDTPLFSVVQPVYAARIPEARGVLLHSVLATVAAMALITAALLLRDATRALARAVLRQRRAAPADAPDDVSVRDATAGDARAA